MRSQQETQMRLLRALRDPAHYPHPADSIEVIETHISTVLLAGDYAYKIKKPLDLGFLDFSTLSLRKHFCKEELRLNRRLAPQLYLAVVGFSGSADEPRFDGDSEPFEYAVKMRRFDQEQLLDRVLARGELDTSAVQEMARRVARFHAEASVADPESPFGSPEAVLAPMEENFKQLRSQTDSELSTRLAQLEHWTLNRHAELAEVLKGRKREGFIRECHGDMHLGNMARVEGELTIFDCIEFNDSLRWIDVMSEMAFLTMDLDYREAPALSRTVLDEYLVASGDYAGLALLRFYQVYRAMVRAKVAHIRLAQEGLSEGSRAESFRAYRRHVDLAQTYTTRQTGAVLITHGVSGSGKTTVARAVVHELGAIQLRSDVERKRLFGLEAEARSGSGLDAGIYTEEASERTYARLLELCEEVCRAGFVVVVDATFLKREQREPFRALAERLKLPFLVLDCVAEAEVLRQRVSQRLAAGSDASEADLQVLARQFEADEPPDSKEPSVVVQAGTPVPLDRIRELIHTRAGR